MAENAIATKDTFSGALTVKLESMAPALPKNFNQERFVNNALALLNDNPDLAKYGQQQILMGLVRGATLGLDFYSKEAYLVPYGNKLQYQTSYTGSIKLAKKYSIRPIKDIYAKVVRDGDVFEENIVNGEQSITFKPKSFNDGQIIGAFAVCLFKDGGMQYDVMSISELENTRKHSKASNSPAWRDFTAEMYKKTVLKRLCKHIEIDFENVDQLRVYDEETAIETDEHELIQQEISENANSVELDIDGEILDENGKPVFA